MRYMRQLDGLRAFAVLSVLFDHFAGERLNGLVPIGAGNLGVNLFFTLSGFLITGILMQGFEREATRQDAWTNFYIRRAARLAPLLVVTIAALAALDIGTLATSWPWHLLYLSNFYVASGGEKTVFWTLAVEEQFYLVWPFVIAFAPRRHLLGIAWGLFAAGIAWKLSAHLAGLPKMTANVMLPGSFEPIGMGCILAIRSYRDGKANRFDGFAARDIRVFGMVAGACLSAAIALWVVLGPHSLLRHFTIDALMAIAYGWIVLMAARGFDGAVGSLLGHPLLNYLGRISYGVYLLHNWMPSILEKFAGPLPKPIAAPFVLVMTFGAAAFSYRFLETPIRELGHRLRPPPAPANAPTGSFADAVLETVAIPADGFAVARATD